MADPETPATPEAAPPAAWWRQGALIAGPLLALAALAAPAPADMPVEAWRLVAVAGWMVLWWLTQAVPLAVTALLPVALLPVLGIAPVGLVTAQYGNDLIFLFLGGFLVAQAMQAQGLHRRIALAIVARMGMAPGRIVLGFMLATAFLSMWISNTATAVMMYAVGVSLIEVVARSGADAVAVRRFGVALMLGIAYSASIGGLGTLIGTPGNALLASILARTHGITLDFGTWMVIALPVVAVMLPLTWALLTRVLFPCGPMRLTGAADALMRERAALGRMGQGEWMVGVVFALAALGWMGRGVIGLPVSDAGIAIIAAITLFALPAGNGTRVIGWQTAARLPWNVLILLGGGLALATGFEVTGLAGWIGARFAAIGTIDLWLMILLVTIVTVYLTEVASNTAVTATFVPVLAAVALGMGVAVEWLTIPVALASSMAFMMPVATPPNAIVFSWPGLAMGDMLRAGLWLNVLGIVVIFVLMWFWAGPVLGL